MALTLKERMAAEERAAREAARAARVADIEAIVREWRRGYMSSKWDQEIHDFAVEYAEGEAR